MIKRILQLCIAAVLAFGFVQKAEALELEYVVGEVKEISKTTLIIKEKETKELMKFKIHIDTLMMNDDGEKVELDDIKKRDLIAVYTAPDQKQAEIIITDVKKEGFIPEYFEVEEIIERGKNNIRVLNQEKDLIASISKDTKRMVYGTDESFDYSGLKVNDRLMVWYEIALLSYPAQAGMMKALLLPDYNHGWVLSDHHWFYYENNVLVRDRWIPSTEGRWFYVDKNGVMSTNTYVEGYWVDDEGVYKANR